MCNTTILPLYTSTAVSHNTSNKVNSLLRSITTFFWSIGDGTIWRQLAGNSNDSLDTNSWTRQMELQPILLQHSYSSAQHALLFQFIQILHQLYQRNNETNHYNGQLRITEFYNHITAWAEIAMHSNFHNITICITVSTASTTSTEQGTTLSLHQIWLATT